MLPRAPLLDDTLGPLAWDEQCAQWVGGYEVSGHSVHVTIAPDDEPTDVVMETSRSVLRRVSRSDLDVRLGAVVRIIANLSGLGTETDWATHQRLAGRLSLEIATVYADGSAELVYDDGGAFGGRPILAAIDDAGELYSASIVA